MEDESCPQALFFNHLYDPISLVRDNELKAAMLALQIHCQSFNADVLYEPWEVLDADGQPFTCFQDFWDWYVGLESSFCERAQLRDAERATFTHMYMNQHVL